MRAAAEGRGVGSSFLARTPSILAWSVSWAIVKSITQAHDGTLSIVPRPDGGICVTAQLPAGVSSPNGVSGVVG
jgi:hypothetical protein